MWAKVWSSPFCLKSIHQFVNTDTNTLQIEVQLKETFIPIVLCSVLSQV